MVELQGPLYTSKYTRVFHEDSDEMHYNAPHHFKVHKVLEDGSIPRHLDPLQEVDFQEGPIKVVGVNGVANEDLINMVICRLQYFQESPFTCRENALAIEKLEEALMWLRHRTTERSQRGVEGTNTI